MSLQKLAVLIPCHNEEPSVVGVIRDFQKHFPDASVTVIDNASEDRTKSVSEQAGVRVISVPELGKGNAVRKGFSEVDADFYILVDGDGTYLASDAVILYKRILKLGAGMVSGSRLRRSPQPGFSLHRGMSNWVASLLFSTYLRSIVRDPLTGLRILSRDLVRRIEPLGSTGFEIETEIVVKAIRTGLPVEEITIDYLPRQPGSHSKLKLWRDALRISKVLFLGFPTERN